MFLFEPHLPLLLLKGEGDPPAQAHQLSFLLGELRLCPPAAADRVAGNRPAGCTANFLSSQLAWCLLVFLPLIVLLLFIGSQTQTKSVQGPQGANSRRHKLFLSLSTPTPLLSSRGCSTIPSTLQL
jgi:hypothetical protein